MNKKSITKKQIAIIAVFVAVYMAVISVGSVVFAHSIKELRSSGLIIPQNFYFVSDYLKEGGASYTITGTTATIKVQNNDGLNITTANITYDITTSKTNSLTDAGTGKTLTGNTSSTATYTLTGVTGETITVTAKSTAPYEKTLSASFTFQSASGEAAKYQVEDMGNYVILNVYTGSTADISVTYNSTILAPDNTNDKMSTWTAGSGTASISGLSTYSHYQFIFFDNTSNDYSMTTEKQVSGAINMTIKN